MQMRLIFAASVVLAAVSAHASFDLMIAPDTVSGRYVRYDPINRIALGTLNISSSNRVTAVSSRQGGLYTYSGGWMQVNNFTGERLSNPSFSTLETLLFNSDGSKVAQYTDYTVRISTLSSTTGLLVNGPSWTVPSGFMVKGVTPAKDNRWIVYGTTSLGLSAYIITDSGTTVGSPTQIVSTANMLTSGIGMGIAVPYGTSEQFAVCFRSKTKQHQMATMEIRSNGFGMVFSQILSNFSSTDGNNSLGLVAGHNGFFVVGADAVTPTSTRITEMDSITPFYEVDSHTTTAFAPPFLTSWRMANLVAPEPGPMIALGVGLAALIGRRRRKN